MAEALRHGLAVVLNVHHYEEMIEDPAGHRPRLRALWQQIAPHYADQPETVYFEILNEPRHALDQVWNDVLAENLAIIRSSNPTRAVIVGPPHNNGIERIEDLALPDDPMLIVGIHYYSPAKFTHQGAVWISDAKDWMGTEWHGSPREQRIVRQDFDRAERWAKANDVPLYLGEFGSIEKADMPSRVRWTAFVRSEASRRGWPWAYWEFRSIFGAYDAKAGAWNQLFSAMEPALAQR